MTTIDPNVVDTHLAHGLRERAADLGDEDRFYEQVLATIALQPQRRWFGRRPAGFGRRFAGHTTRRLTWRRGVTLLAAAALVGALVVSAAIGARFLAPPPVVPTQLPSLLPTQLPSPLPSGLRSTQPSVVPGMGRIIYTSWKRLAMGEEDCTSRFSCYRASVFVSNDDGSDVQELFPGPNSYVLAASRDGSKVIVSISESGEDHIYLTDVDGSAPRLLDTHCQAPCQDDWGFSFSADGSRLSFTRVRSGEPGLTGEDLVVATMDLRTGAVVELESTHDYWGRPGLSPDGARVVFGNHVVDAEGSNLRRIAPADLFTDEQGFTAGVAVPQWSLDGSLIAFTSFNDTFPTNPPERNSQQRMDIYVVRPDGTGLQRLTTDSVGPLARTIPVASALRSDLDP